MVNISYTWDVRPPLTYRLIGGAAPEQAAPGALQQPDGKTGESAETAAPSTPPKPTNKWFAASVLFCFAGAWALYAMNEQEKSEERTARAVIEKTVKGYRNCTWRTEGSFFTSEQRDGTFITYGPMLAFKGDPKEVLKENVQFFVRDGGAHYVYSWHIAKEGIGGVAKPVYFTAKASLVTPARMVLTEESDAIPPDVRAHVEGCRDTVEQASLKELATYHRRPLWKHMF